MNNNIMSVVFASDSAEAKLNELTIHRTTASLPFCMAAWSIVVREI